jgi:uncharacterized membrane protein
MSSDDQQLPLIGDAVPSIGHRSRARVRLRNYFLTGLIVAGPLTITIYITWWFITLVDGWVKPLVPQRYLPETYLPFQIPGFGLIIAFTGLTLLGFLTANLVGRTLLEIGEVVLTRMPVVRGIYRGTKQIFETIFSTTGTSFRTVGLVEFPVKGTWSIVFISTPPGPDLTEQLPEAGEYMGVFLPCTPNPTTGFFFYLPRKDVIELSMSVDDAAKLVMSAGVIQPDETQRRLQAMAEAAARSNGRTEPVRSLEPS